MLSATLRRQVTFRPLARLFSAEANLVTHNIALPPAPGPKANYMPYKRVGNTLFLSGHLPMLDNGDLLTGTVGGAGNLTTEEGANVARQCGLNLLASIKDAAGSLDNVEGVTKLFGLVQSDKSFKEQHLVLNGCSDLMCQVFGPDVGLHARSAVGVNTLPLDMAVEIEAIVQLKPM